MYEMATTNKTLRVCSKGHKYYKSSDCPVCPICEKEKAPVAEFHSTIGAPARRALENAGIKTTVQLSKWTEKELSKLHGMGPNALGKLKAVLKAEGLSFKK